MKKLEIGKWIIEADLGATHRAYKKTDRGSPGDCSCNICRNLVALGENAYPESFRKLLAELGIDYRKAAEIFEMGSSSRKHLNYWGWFHFVGKIVSGPLHEQEWFAWEKDFTISLTSNRALAFEEFNDMELVQIDFNSTSVPWVLDEKMPSLGK